MLETFVVWLKRSFGINWAVVLFNEKCYDRIFLGKEVSRRVQYGFYTIDATVVLQCLHPDITNWLNENCNKNDYSYLVSSGDLKNNPNDVRLDTSQLLPLQNTPPRYIQESNIIGIKFVRKEDALAFKLSFF